VVLLLCLVYFTARDRQRLTLAEQVAREVFAPVARLGSRFGTWVSSWASFVSSIGATKAENERLAREVDRLVSENLALSEAARENERLRALLDLKSSMPGRTLGARVAFRDPGNWLSTIVVDRGSADGVRNGMAVIDPRGVVGRVTSVTPKTAAVLLAVDGRSAIGGLNTRSRDLLVVEGLGDGSGLCVARPLGAESDLAVGDVVITSGLGGIYPRGHVIGDVVSVEQGKYGVSSIGYVRPRVDFERLEEVLVLLERIEGKAE
jgi:rod shape-determining protein MreC